MPPTTNLPAKASKPRKPKATGFTRADSVIVWRARAATYLSDMAMGLNIAAIAKKYNVSTYIVKQTLDWAKRENFYEKATDAINNRLVPKAIDVFEVALNKALQTGDIEAAKEVLKGIRLLGGGPQRNVGASPEDVATSNGNASSSTQSLTWERFMMTRSVSGAPDEEPSANPFDVDEGGDESDSDSLPTLDAEIVREIGDEEGDAGQQPADAEGLG